MDLDLQIGEPVKMMTKEKLESLLKTAYAAGRTDQNRAQFRTIQGGGGGFLTHQAELEKIFVSETLPKLVEEADRMED